MALRIYIFGEDGFLNRTLAASLAILGFDVIGENDNENAALNLISHHCPDVAVLLIDYRRIKAAELAQSIRKKFPKMGIVIVAKIQDIRLYGLSSKYLPAGTLIAEVAKHEDLDYLRKIIELAPKSTNTPVTFKEIAKLTDAQVETLRLLAEGKANSEIAKVRYVSEKSVEQMLARIAQMLGIVFDHKQNSRIRILNSYYELVSGRR